MTIIQGYLKATKISKDLQQDFLKTCRDNYDGHQAYKYRYNHSLCTHTDHYVKLWIFFYFEILSLHSHWLERRSVFCRYTYPSSCQRNSVVQIIQSRLCPTIGSKKPVMRPSRVISFREEQLASSMRNFKKHEFNFHHDEEFKTPSTQTKRFQVKR